MGHDLETSRGGGPRRGGAVCASSGLRGDLLPCRKQNEQHTRDTKNVAFSRIDREEVENDPAKRNHRKESELQYSRYLRLSFEACERRVGQKNGIDKSTYENGEI